MSLHDTGNIAVISLVMRVAGLYCAQRLRSAEKIVNEVQVLLSSCGCQLCLIGNSLSLSLKEGVLNFQGTLSDTMKIWLTTHND